MRRLFECFFNRFYVYSVVSTYAEMQVEVSWQNGHVRCDGVAPQDLPAPIVVRGGKLCDDIPLRHVSVAVSDTGQPALLEELISVSRE
jgi:hypothetical protein